MVAVDKAPRIARETTNMEDAAAALRARRDRRQAKSPADHVDPDLIDNALADLEYARIFLDATDRYFDELNEWLCPKGHAPNRALHAEVHKGQALMNLADDRIGFAEDRLRKALEQSFTAMPSLPSPRDAVRFAEAMHHYRTAFLLGQSYHLLNHPGPGDDFTEFEAAFDEYVSLAVAAERALILTPASSIADMEAKLAVLEQQDGWNRDPDSSEAYMRQLIADAIALAGGAA